MSQLKVYPEYKDSGVEWIGLIPEQWEIKKYKRTFTIINGHGFPHNLQGDKKGDKPFLKVSDISFKGKYVEKSSNYVSDLTIKLNKWNEIEPYSILTAKIGEALRKNHRKINIIPCIIDNNMMGLTPNIEDNLDYLYYILNVVDLDWYSNPGAVPSVNNRHFREDFLMIPPYQEQIKISHFLNNKTSEIDNLISDKERLIELLEEKRQAVITETVTKGLDPNVEVKDSGIEWIGEMPEHWDLIKLKYIFNIKNGGTPKSDELRYWNDNGIIWITPGDLSSPGFRISDSKNKISEEGLKNSSANYISKDSIVMSTRAPIGNMKLATKNYTTNQGCKSLEITNNNINVLYYFYLLRFKKDVLQSLGQGTTFLELSNNSLKNFQVPIMSINEQTNIINIIEKLNTDIESALKKIKNQISKLKEYRESLIYEAVTGKIDVRDYVVEQEEVY